MGRITTTNKYLTDIEWLKPIQHSFEINKSTDVWKIDIRPHQALIDSFLTVLTVDEIARAKRYYRQTDHNKFVISRAVLKYILGKYLGLAPSAVELGIGKNKKPFVSNTNSLNVQYNMSHSSDAILLAVSDLAVGADVELINYGFSFDDVLDDNFSTGEIAYIKETESAKRFFKLWTRKEALTKATAQGLDGDLRLIPSLDGIYSIEPGVIASANDWLISSFIFNDNYTASVAFGPLIKKIRFFDLDVIGDLHIF